MSHISYRVKTRIIVGAESAYACITWQAKDGSDSGTLDIQLLPGHGAAHSLCERAAEYRAKAERYLRMADLADAARATL